MKNDVKPEQGSMKRIFSLKVPLVCISFYLIITAFLLAFLKDSEYISIPSLIFVFLLLVFPAFFGAYGCRVTRSVVATFIYFFVISFVYFLPGFAYTATQKSNMTVRFRR